VRYNFVAVLMRGHQISLSKRCDCSACETRVMSPRRNNNPSARTQLRRGVILEQLTLGWNVVGVVVLAYAALAARSVALAGFGLDSVVEIGASIVVLWELTDASKSRQSRALRRIGAAFILLSVYIAAQSTVVLLTHYHPQHSLLGIGWTAATALVMFTLAAGKARTGKELRNPVLQLEGRVTFVDGLLATAVLIGLVLNVALHAWWADPAAGYVIVFYGVKESIAIFSDHH
jgi:divalent metal cation (Fe/Co/Zn/Cd) transporter